MIIFNGSGRLGNQIFQLFYLESIRKPNEKVFTLGLKDVLYYFTGYRKIRNTNSKRFGKFFNRFIRRLLLILSYARIINIRYEEEFTMKYKERKGFLPITYAYGYFQDEKFFDKEICKKIFIKKQYIQEGNDFIKHFKIPTNPYFIHIRHGDYSNEAVLPVEYYIDALTRFDKNNFYILIGDDPQWYKNNLCKYIKNYVISDQNLIIDLYLMTQCYGGIISNSTFAFWGAYFCKHKDIIIAPKYWTGYNHKQWDNTGISNTTFLEFI